MPNGTELTSELLSAPIEAVIIAVGTGVAKAQQELDRFAIETQREIDEDPFLSENGLQATFYQIPRTDLELTVALALEEDASEPGRPTLSGRNIAAEVLQPFRLKQVYLQPVNAQYTNRFSYDVQASSKVNLTIVPVPPRVTSAATAPRLTRDAVVDIARPNLVTDASGNIPADARLAVNFNGQSRTWFVLEYRLVDNELHRIALVVVDDDTGTVIKSVKEST